MTPAVMVCVWVCVCARASCKLINCNEVELLELQDIRGAIGVFQPSQGQLFLGTHSASLPSLYLSFSDLRINCVDRL